MGVDIVYTAAAALAAAALAAAAMRRVRATGGVLSFVGCARMAAMARNRRKRLKWWIGGGGLLSLLFLMGDPFGWFRAAADGPASESFDGPAAAVARFRPETAESGRVASRVPSAAPRPAVPPTVVPRPAVPPTAAHVDEWMGLLARCENALAADDLAGLAVLVDGVRSRPDGVPPALAARWRTVRARAAAALACGDRLRRLIANGEILAAERLIAPILAASTPAWVRAGLDAETKSFGWPALSRKWQVVASAATHPVALARMRRVRFLEDGRLRAGRLWRGGGARVTVRVAGGGGYAFPRVARRDIEPVAPKSREAFAQGVVAARASRALRVALWSCHFHEHGDAVRETRLAALIR